MKAVRPVILAALLGCVAAGPRRYVNEPYGFSFEPPSGWTRVAEPPDPAIVSFKAASEHGFEPNVNIVAENVGNATVDAYLNDTKFRISAVRGMRIGPVKITTLGGLPARAWRGHLIASRDVALRQVICVRNGRGYVIALVALPATIYKLDPAFDRLLASFKWNSNRPR